MKLLKYIIPAAAIAIVLFFLIRGCTPTPSQTITTIHDTSYIAHDSIIYRDTGKIITKTIKIPITEIPKPLQPSNNPDTLVQQYGNLLTAHTNKHIYLDTLRIDTIGWVAITDTVQYNSLQARKYTYSVKERQIFTTTTITKTVPKKNMVFGGIEAGFTGQQFHSASVGLLLLNRKDNMIGVSAGIDFPSKSPIYQAKYYTKLHF